MTEFCAWEPNVSNVQTQMRFMSNAINYLESDPNVVKYAWFIPRANGPINSYPYMQLLTKSAPYELSDLGKVYVNLSTLDKETFYPVNQRIEAEHYSSLDIEETVLEGGFKTSVNLQPSTDVDGVLEVHNFFINQWLEYQVNTPKEGKYSLVLRYATQFDTTLEVSLFGTTIATINLNNTGSDTTWNNSLTLISLPRGKQTIRLKVKNGALALNWLKIKNNKENILY